MGSRAYIAFLALAVAGCGGSTPLTSSAPKAPEQIQLTSTAFKDGGTIPKPYTCSGAGDPPPLRGTNVPRSAKSMALLMEDPDAPGGAFVHWTTWNLSPRSLASTDHPSEGKNSSGRTGWTPPCPPKGDKPHRYVFTLYALSKPLGLANGASADAVHRALRGKAIAMGRLTGRFGR
jgi:Raf kinase inhibitor-like YbhB/YbcL family protein